jgi:uncharacterized protein YkuJ
VLVRENLKVRKRNKNMEREGEPIHRRVAFLSVFMLQAYKDPSKNQNYDNSDKKAITVVLMFYVSHTHKIVELCMNYV